MYEFLIGNNKNKKREIFSVLLENISLQIVFFLQPLSRLPYKLVHTRAHFLCTKYVLTGTESIRTAIYSGYMPLSGTISCGHSLMDFIVGNTVLWFPYLLKWVVLRRMKGDSETKALGSVPGSC